VAQNVDDFRGRLNRVIGAIEAVGGLLHGGDSIDHFFARAIGDVEQNLGGIRHAIDGSNHLVYRSGSFRDAGSLHLRIFDHVLHVDAHLVHGAGDFFDRGRRLHAHLADSSAAPATWLDPAETWLAESRVVRTSS